MQGLKSVLIAGALFSIHSFAFATTINLCVFDVMGVNGTTMAVAKDYALAAKQWNVEIQPKVYTQLQSAIADFESKKCKGLVADNFITRKYNNFMATIGAVGAIPDYGLAQKVLGTLGNPKLASKMRNDNYEVIGYLPYGLAYFFSKDRSIKSLSHLNGKRLGILDFDPSQRRMAQKVGMVPVSMTFDDAASKFRRGDFDVVPAPLIVYQPFEMEKILGVKGGVANYPLAFMTMNVILHRGDYPDDFGQKSREWFSKRVQRMMHAVLRADNTVPKRMLFEIPEIDRSGYDTLLSQMRKEFIENKTYDGSMMALIKHFRCIQEPQFVECKKN